MISIYLYTHFIVKNDEKVERLNALFKSSHIEGIIEETEIFFKCPTFKIQGDTNTYLFYPSVISKHNKPMGFSYTAKVGDSVYKSADSRFLILNHEGIIVRYKDTRD